jgi:hypothetical protein
LRAEGIGDFQEVDLPSLTAGGLRRFGAVVLTSCGAVPGLLDLLGAYVEEGGRLVLLRPALELAPLSGLEPLYRALAGAGLLVERGHPAFGGFPYEPLQLIGAVDLYRAGPDTTVVARTVAGRWPVESHPAVVERTSGRGRVLSFLYDLPHTVARLRQGDPLLAGHDTDGLVGVRPSDAQQWQIDPEAGQMPQAEVHQALLARAVEWLCPWPVPRLWYLPGEARALLVLTGDLCTNRPDEWLVEEAALAERHGGTVSYYLHERATFDPQTAEALRARGHTFSVHPFAEPFSAPEMDATLARHLNGFEARYGVRPHTVRHHRLQWLGWAEQARIEARHGLEMDLNFTTVRPLRSGYLFGAGRPVRFVDEDGEVLPVWQQPTHFEDDLILGDHEISLQLETAEACALYDALLDGAQRRWHTALAVNLHPGNFARYSGDWGRHLVAQTARRSVPVWEAERWLTFTRARAGLRTGRPAALPHADTAVTGAGGSAWRVDVPWGTDEADLLLLVPERYAPDRTARVNGAPVPGLREPSEGPVIDLYGWTYRGVPLRGAPAAFDLRYGSARRSRPASD